MEEVILRMKGGVTITIWPKVEWVTVASPLREAFSMTLEAFHRTVEKDLRRRLRGRGKGR